MHPVVALAIVGAIALLVTGAAGAAGASGATGGTGAAGGHPGRAADAPLAAADTFPHERHKKLACLECHETGTGHGRLTFEPPRGCALCHHQAPPVDKCATCHRPEQYGVGKPATVTIKVPDRDPRPRSVEFLHERHTTRTCLECHTTPVTLRVPPTTSSCQDCHSEHHEVGPTCSACHQIADPRLEHKAPDVAHQRCDACHTPQTIAQLTPTRALCSTCHAPQAKEHYEARECTTCHFLAEPAAYRPFLLTPARR